MELKQESKVDQRVLGALQFDFEIAEAGLYILEVRARAKSWLQNTLRFISFFRDDDLQLIVDNKRQINDTPRSHKYWYWCGRVLRGQARIFEKN